MPTFRHGKRLVTFRDADVATVVDRREPDGARLPIGLTSLQQPGLDVPLLALPPNPFTVFITVGGIATRPAVAGGAPRRLLSLGGAMDHAVIDGAALARFGVTLQARLRIRRACGS